MDRVDEGQEYSKNVQILQQLLINHDEFAEHNKRKLKALEEGKPIDGRQKLNPVLSEKVADVIRQLDKDSKKDIGKSAP